LFAGYDVARLYNLANTLATVSGVLFGFLLTAIAMMISLPDRRLIANMRLTGHYRVLMKGTLRACGAHFAALAISLLAAFSEGRFLEWAVMLALSVEVFAILRTAQAGRRFWLVLEALEHSE
jgi:hypothetical protein